MGARGTAKASTRRLTEPIKPRALLFCAAIFRPKNLQVLLAPAQPVDTTPALQPELINNTCESNIEAFFVGQSYVRYRSEAALLKLAHCVRKDLLRNG